MARELGTFNFSNNFEVLKAGPLDARLAVTELNELTGLPFIYKGMVVAVTDDAVVSNNGVYVNKGTGDVLADWEQLGAGTDSGSSGPELYDSTFPTTQEVPESLGGIDSGTTVGSLEGKTYSELFDQLLFPAILPTVSSQPSVSLNDDVPSLIEIGATEDIAFTTNANRGLISSSWNGTNAPYAGEVTAASYSGMTTGTLTVGPGDTQIANFAANTYTVVEGINSWTLTATFDDGADFVDSNGNVITGTGFNSGTRTNSTQFEGVYPIFLGDATGALVKRALISHNANNIECPQEYDETSSIRHQIAIPDSLINGRSVSFEAFNPDFQTWNALNASEFTATSTTQNVQGNSVNYTLYTKSSSIGGGNLFRIVF